MRVIGGGSFGSGFADAVRMQAAERAERQRAMQQAQESRRDYNLRAQALTAQKAQSEADALLERQKMDRATAVSEANRVFQERQLKQEDDLARARLAQSERDAQARIEADNQARIDRNTLQLAQIDESKRYHDLSDAQRRDALDAQRQSRMDALAASEEQKRQNRLLGLGQRAALLGADDIAGQAYDEANVSEGTLLRRNGVGPVGPMIPEAAPEDPSIALGRFVQQRNAEAKAEKAAREAALLAEKQQAALDRTNADLEKDQASKDKRRESFIKDLSGKRIDQALSMFSQSELAKEVPDAIENHPDYAFITTVLSDPAEEKRLLTEPTEGQLALDKGARSALMKERLGMSAVQFRALLDKVRKYQQGKPSAEALDVSRKNGISVEEAQKRIDAMTELMTGAGSPTSVKIPEADIRRQALLASMASEGYQGLSDMNERQLQAIKLR